MRKNLTNNLKTLLLFSMVLSLTGLLTSCSKRTYSAFQEGPAKGQQMTITGSPFSPLVEKIPDNPWPVIDNASTVREPQQTIGELTQKLPLGKRLAMKALLKKSGVNE